MSIFSNWKTTITGIVGFAALLLGQLNVIQITPENQQTIVAFVILVIGLLAKDGSKPDGDPEEDSE